ncbi:MAG: nitrite/sulfite reductase [Sedimentisphaerales bacterium]|nr:nitrite/sulfite reductase [Sedimentisphaerales bacterium]
MDAPKPMSLHLSRRYGVYPQKQEGLYMQRIRIPGGRINAEQWRRLAHLAVACCRGTPLHLTTRQDVELHNVAASDLPTIQELLGRVQLQTGNTGGDSIRNITLCPGCDLKEGGRDLLPLIETVYSSLSSLPLCDHLPRKFKISFSACNEQCALPYLNDLGFVLTPGLQFDVIGAGSLGPRPNPGIELTKNLPAEEMIPFTIAVLELFEEMGDRNHRRKARLRHVRERLGDAVFKEVLHRRFEEKRKSGPYPHVAILPGKERLPHRSCLRLPLGDLSVEQAVTLADLLDKQRLQSRINLTQDIELYGNDPIVLPTSLILLTRGPSIVCCPGADTCPNGLVNTRQLARRLIQENLPSALHTPCIRISGCPNRCAHCAAAEIGLSGCLKTIQGNRQQAYRLYLGGGNGKSNQLGSPGPVLTEEEVVRFLAEEGKSHTRE